MTTTTTIASSINAAAEKARYDAACKQILSEKIILAWIMKHTMEEYASFSVQEIADRYIIGSPQVAEVPVLPDETNSKISGTGVEDTTVTEGTVTFDIRFYAFSPAAGEQVSLIINVESQYDFYPGYPLIKRALYYCCRMISSQRGTEFTKSHYEKIKKVYSIWVCINPPQYRENTINSYRITEEQVFGNVKETTAYYDLLSAVMICLGKPDKADPNGLLRLLDVLLSSDTDTTAKKRILSEEFDIPMTYHIERSMDEMCNLGEGIWQKGIAEGKLLGLAEGKSLGLIEGEEKTLLSSIKNLMDSVHWTSEQAMDALKIPGSDREKYRSLILMEK